MKTLLLAIFISLIGLNSDAKVFGIFVDGSYSPGRESTIDRMIDGRLEEASNQMQRLFPIASDNQSILKKTFWLLCGASNVGVEMKLT